MSIARLFKVLGLMQRHNSEKPKFSRFKRKLNRRLLTDISERGKK